MLALALRWALRAPPKPPVFVDLIDQDSAIITVREYSEWRWGAAREARYAYVPESEKYQAYWVKEGTGDIWSADDPKSKTVSFGERLYSMMLFERARREASRGAGVTAGDTDS